MEHLDSFKEFLKEKKRAEEQKKVNWEERKSLWVKSVSKLYESISSWLQPFMNEGLLTVKTDITVNISEAYIGQYSIKRYDIYLGNDIVSLTPKGTLILGSYGRIDMSGSKGEIMLIETEWNNWKFAKRTPKLETWDVTDESFTAILQSLV